MDFSSDILIQFGLNLIGYMIAGLLVYILTAGVRKVAPSSIPTTGSAVAGLSQPQENPDSADAVTTADPEIILLTDNNPPAVKAPACESPSATTVGDGPEQKRINSRRDNRKAIYREAREFVQAGNLLF